ncbi:hypothetical protein A2482_00445 [Candidatus Falkowbacteria bacterium RIFOXYC2_FULL_48_21]|uniref:Uncharacterized protein n=1 Tax=Candidatus Falkowbacteria bacterium RIFOXYC2_FULL_48_21 TaxID=1798005 RepID=A0A1F5TFM9_9BACT|nr:MAG: hypothetical protein A2482_00445 [Candidatus Falkowbacteria bacterium RIFOXYC2_FULL_48_21]
MTMHVFGDIFRHQERDYVLLAHSGELVYAAQILSHCDTERIRALDNRRSTRPDLLDKTDGCRLYCYVVLTTPKLVGRCAHLNTPEKDACLDCFFEWQGISVNADDQKMLRSEILRPGSPVSVGLKKIVAGLDV